MDLTKAPGGDGTLVEVKFSGEQIGPPYVPQPGRFDPLTAGPSDWKASYLYEDYLDGDAPYDFVFQVKLTRFADS